MGFWKAVKTIEDAIKEYLSDNPKVASVLEKNNATLSVTHLPDKYNHINFDGYKIGPDGKYYNNLGEYKAACDKNYQENHSWEQ